VFQLQAAVIGEKRSQVEKEIEGLKAQESAASRRVGIVRDEAATVAMLVEKGLERRPRLVNLEREAADIEGRRGEIAAQISRAEQVINESQATLIKLENDRQNEIAQSLRELQSQIFQICERLQAADDQLLRTAATFRKIRRLAGGVLYRLSRPLQRSTASVRLLAEHFRMIC
jgi:HlyD family secretion protein